MLSKKKKPQYFNHILNLLSLPRCVENILSMDCNIIYKSATISSKNLTISPIEVRGLNVVFPSIRPVQTACFIVWMRQESKTYQFFFIFESEYIYSFYHK